MSFFGCSNNIPTLNDRMNTASTLAEKSNLKEHIYQLNKFNLFTYQTSLDGCETLKVYIEGDGLAWVTRSRISSDPTPLNPLSLKLMILDKSICKLYIARPCQYASSNSCNKKYWTSHRFSQDIISDYDQLFSEVKAKYNIVKFEVVGYSGGAAISSLIANKRSDVKSLITVAGNLNTTLWTDIKNLTPLSGSLNPADYTNNLKNVKQFHLIGKDDTVIPKEILYSYINKFENKSNIFYKVFDATHSKNWEISYKEFLDLKQGKVSLPEFLFA